MKGYDELSKLGYNKFDLKSPDFNYYCIPMKKDKKEAVISDKRDKLDNVIASYNENCKMEIINRASV